MNAAYRNAVANAGAALITHVGLVDDTGTELSGGSPEYSRQSVSWTTAPTSGIDGLVRPTADLDFNVPAGASVAGWRGFSAATGGTDYGGGVLPQEDYTGQGTYKLLAAQTGIRHNAGS